MLNALREYAIDRDLIASPGLVRKKVKWHIHLDGQGRLIGINEGSDGLESGVPQQIDSAMNVPGRSQFMVETADVVLLLGVDNLDPNDAKVQERLKRKHEYFKILLKESSVAFAANGICADFLDDDVELGKAKAQLKEQRAKATDTVAFAINGELLIRNSSWHAWWLEKRAKVRCPAQSNGAQATPMRCLMTGDMVIPVLTNEKIKGMRRIKGQAKSSLVSFDKAAFSSYGLEQALNAAMSEEAVQAYQAALNDLIPQSHSFKEDKDGILMLAWYKERIPPKDDIALWLYKRTPEEEYSAKTGAELSARALLNSIESGERTDLASNIYYAMTLSATGARIVVRDFGSITFSGLARNIVRWFDDLSLWGGGGTQLKVPKLWGLLSGITTVDHSGNPLWDSVPSHMITALQHCALYGRDVPHEIIPKAVIRLRNESLSGGLAFKSSEAKTKGINYGALQLLKIYHIRKDRKEGKTMDQSIKPGLNPDHPSKAYHAGRAMAVLAKLQQKAVGDVGAGVIERFYGSFSTTPALVYGRLVKLAQAHLSSVGKNKPGLRNWFDNELAEINTKLGDGLPNVFSLEEQSLFALGYYQQLVIRAKQNKETQGDETNDQGN